MDFENKNIIGVIRIRTIMRQWKGLPKDTIDEYEFDDWDEEE